MLPLRLRIFRLAMIDPHAKKFMAILMAMLFPLAMWSADWKVIDRSDKHTPDWLGSISDDYLVVEVERPNLEEAQKAAELELARRIVSSVAISVDASSSAGGNEYMSDDSLSSSEYFEYDTRTASARLPFMKGISLARALDTYWELREDKKTKHRYVIFSVKYPLSKRELDDMHSEFEKLDAEKMAEFNALKDGISDVDSSQDIRLAIAKLGALQEYFFDKARIAEAKGLEKSYKNLYKALTLHSEIDTLRKQAVVSVLLNGHPFKSDANPKVTSECAGEIEVSHSDDGYDFIIKYDDKYCIEGEDNFLEFNLRLEGTRLNTKIYF